MSLRKSYIGKPYATYTHADPFAPKRWLHQRRFRDALKLLEGLDRRSILDYRTGDGHFLRLCKDRFPEAEVIGYDPVQRPDETGLVIVHDPAELPSHRFTVVTFLETGEHLTDDVLRNELSTIRNVMAPNGRLVVSVPVETGIPAAVKNLYRAIRRKGYERLNIVNYWKALFGIPFERKVNVIAGDHRYIHSHMGFSHRRFEKVLREFGAIERRIGSPVPAFGSVLNTSLYYVVALP